MQEELKILKDEIKQIKIDIKEQTKTLQANLKIKEAEAKVLKLKIKNQAKIEMNDKSKHIMERFSLWLNSTEKDESDWIIDDGPMRDLVFSDMNRYETIDYVEDMLIDYIYGEVEDYTHFEDIEKDKKIFDELKSATQKELKELMEDAIEQNVHSFKVDW
jgi:glucose-6-phosphate 1-dehydrogenase